MLSLKNNVVHAVILDNNYKVPYIMGAFFIYKESAFKKLQKSTNKCIEIY